MRSVDEQLQRLLSSVDPLPPFPIGLTDARGCVVAEDVYPAWPVPFCDLAAVDGYAVIADDLRGTAFAPVTLAVADVVVAGQASDVEITSGHCARVAMGGAVPAGADALVPVSHTDGGLEDVVVSRIAMPGDNIRRQGRDLPADEAVVRAGNVVDARTVGLLSAIGRSQVLAHPRPRVVVMSVGSDLVETGGALSAGRTVDSNAPMLAAAIAEAGGMPYRVGPVSEDAEVLKRTLEDQLVRADLVILLGSMSSLSYDRIFQIVSEVGEGELVRVAITPGGAQGVGVLGEERIPVLTLPSNPLSVFVSFEVFIRPLLRKLMGFEQAQEPLLPAYSATTFKVEPGKRNYLRARRVRRSEERLVVEPLDLNSERPLAGLAETDYLIVVPEAVVEVSAGDRVDVLPLHSHSVR